MAVSKKFRWVNEDGEILEVDIGVKSENVSVGEQSLDDVLGTKADKQTTMGGFAGGSESSAKNGGAIGKGATTQYGGAVGLDVHSEDGFAGGDSASATSGGTIGSGSSTQGGGSAGYYSGSKDGGAVGLETKTSDGFAGGKNAQCVDGDNNGIDAIQLGTGTNSVPKTVKAYDYTLMNADGSIPPERVQNALEDVSNIANLAHAHYGICSTAAGTAAKVVTISNFKLVNGAEAWVYFSASNTAADPTLNINGTGAKSIYASTSFGLRKISTNLRSGLYQMVYRDSCYYAFSHVLMPSHQYVYKPDSANAYTYYYGWVTTNTGFPTPRPDTLLLPGTYTRTSPTSAISISDVVTHVKGVNKIDKKKQASSVYDSVLDMTPSSVWTYTISSTTPNSVIFEDLYIKLTSSTQYGILQTTAANNDRVIKFKNCVFDIQCIRAFYITSGSIEFENCSFFVTPLTTNDCTHIVEAINTSSNYTAKVSFNNCYFKCTEDDTDKHIYLASLSGYHTRLDITNCELIGCNPYKTEGSTYTSSTSADCNIKITNNSIESIMIGPFDASSSGYQNGCFIFSNNIWTIPNSEVNGANVGMFIVHGGTESVINNNTIMVKSNAPVTFSYWKNLSTGRMLNTFTGNTSNDTLQLYSSGTGNAFLTFTSNTVDGVPTIGTFSDVTNANNTTT